MIYALIIGYGISGKGAEALLRSKGIHTFIYDDQMKNVFDASILKKISFAVVSPGVALSHPLCIEVRARNIELIGEMELGARYVDQPCIGITGTNGKTTAVLELTHILQRCGKPARALGNVGEPLSNYLANPDSSETLVIECSSFQLETMNTPIFSIGVVLNISPDHLDRHGSMESYRVAKMRMKDLVLPGGHFFKGDTVNSVCEVMNLDKSTLSTFQKPPHRLEFAGRVNGAKYLNDSKATNPEATRYALMQMTTPVILLAGGRDKNTPFASWKDLLRQKVKQLIVFGEASDRIEKEVGSACSLLHVKTLDEAVKMAHQIAAGGDTVLLSPGCASFDQFQSYIHRGDAFKHAVSKL